MKIDLEAIARRGGSPISSLRLAQPLLEQGYTPPFLARYRRDELGDLSEGELWMLAEAIERQSNLDAARDRLLQQWESSDPKDSAIGRAIRNAGSRRILDRLSRRLKAEAGQGGSSAQRLAIAVLSPAGGSSQDVEAIADAVQKNLPEGVEFDRDEAIAGLDEALAERLIREPRLLSTAVRWLGRQAKIHVLKVHDPHGGEADKADGEGGGGKKPRRKKRGRGSKSDTDQNNAPGQNNAPEQNNAPGDSANDSSQGAGSPGGAEETLENQQDDAAANVGDVAAQQLPTPEVVEQRTAPDRPAEPTAGNPGVASSGGGDRAVDSPAANTQENADQEEEIQKNENQENDGSGDSSGTTPPASTHLTGGGEVEREPATSDSPGASDAASIEQANPDASSPDESTTSSPDESASSPPDGSASASPDDSVPPSGDESASSSAEPSAPSTPGAKAVPGGPKPMSPKAGPSEKPTVAPKKTKRAKKLSPRQRQRRWLVSVLKPLSNKKIPVERLSAFQTVMLGRALRSQVAVCAFEYDAGKLVTELRRTAASLNETLLDRIDNVVVQNEAVIRESAEAAWWDETQERASEHLVTLAAGQLRRQVDRGGVAARVVMSIDAVGPRTAAVSIVASDGRTLHTEDIPCQLTPAMRSIAVGKMGELIHAHGVDLIVISNGPARRACLIALGELIKQSGDGNLRWTLADRSGAEAYANGPAGNQEMRSTPRRFRAATWIAFSVLQPSQAIVKVDPLKLRLGSFQRELSDEALSAALADVMLSAAARGGVDVNSAPTTWLAQMPGMTREIAESIDKNRRESLFKSREELLQRVQWPSVVHSRQALPLLRVFGSEEPLDGTLIHPDDYAIAKKLAASLSIEMPPASPPGYAAPDYHAAEAEDAADGQGVHADPNAGLERDDDDDSNSDGSTSDDSDDSEPFGEVAQESTLSNSQNDEADGGAASPGDSAESSGEPTETTPQDGPQPEAVADPGTPENATPQDSTAAVDDPSPPQPPQIEDAKRPMPDRAAVDKLIKEWQIGHRRAHQLVRWLCDPFGEGAPAGDSPAVMDRMPTLANLQPGEPVIGVIVGVMPFGLFVELSPECSGLVHVSRISEGFIDDLNEAVQVGDVVTAYVTGIDDKRRRVALTAIDPNRPAPQRAPRGEGGGPRDQRGGPGRGGANRADGGRAQGQSSRGGGGRSQGGGGQGGGGRSAGGGRGQGGGGRGPGGGQGGGGGRGGFGGRDNRRGGNREPETYTVIGKEIPKPELTEEMREGKSPLRSFGDLLQVMKKDAPPPPPPAAPAPPEPPPPAANAAADNASDGAAHPPTDSEQPS